MNPTVTNLNGTALPQPKFLASVSNLAEAQLVVMHDADIIDLKEPANGVLGAVDRDGISHIVTSLNGRHVISATIGDQPLRAVEISRAIADTAATGVDIVKVGWFDDKLDGNVLSSLQQAASRDITLVVVLFAEYGLAVDNLPAFAAAGVRGIMLDTRDKGTGSLRDKLSDSQLALFVKSARQAGLLCGLAGSLRRDDILPLRRLQPDYLGFRGALCQSNRRDAALDEAAVKSVRWLMNTDTHAQMPGNISVCAPLV